MILPCVDHIVGEYGLGGIVDLRAEYIWTLPEIGAAGPTGGDNGLGGYMPMAVVVGTVGDMRFIHSHHNGAPILITNSAGTIVPHGDHAVMGFPGQFANAKQLAGAQHYYNRYRDYNATTGRYIQADPIGLAGDANPYAYAMGNALRYGDPEGLQAGGARPPVRAIMPSQLTPVSPYPGQIAAWNAMGRSLNPRYQGPAYFGNPTARDVANAAQAFARTQAAWAATNRVCLGQGQPGANYRQPNSNNWTPGPNNVYQGSSPRPIFVVDSNGNVIPVGRGQRITTSSNGNYQQLRDSNYTPTGLRLDRGGHPRQSDPAARGPHGHVPGTTQSDGNPHLPIR